VQITKEAPNYRMNELVDRWSAGIGLMVSFGYIINHLDSNQCCSSLPLS